MTSREFPRGVVLITQAKGKKQQVVCEDPFLLSALALEKAQEPPSYYQRIKNVLALFNPFRSEEH